MGRITTLISAVAVALAAIAGPIALAKPAHAASASDEQAFVSAINGVRAARGVAPLAVDSRLTSLGEYWAGRIAAAGALSHNPALTTMSPAGWTAIGENVGEGTGGGTIVEQAFERSAPHLANMVNPAFTSFGVGVVWSGSTLWVSEEFMAGGAQTSVAASATARGFASTADGQGYWASGSDGRVKGFGGAQFHGSMAGTALARPIVGMASTPTAGGYWMVATDGGIFSFGDAAFHGSTGAIRLNQPIVGMASTPSGHGYWLVASDGGIFSFGDAAFYGSTGAVRLAKPVVSMAAAPGGAGYWLVASDGGVFSFGAAPFHGSLGGQALGAPVVSMSPALRSPGGGYWMLGGNGTVYAFGGAVFYGSLSVS